MLRIGPHIFETTAVLAPLAAVTDLPFRTVCEDLTGMGVGLYRSHVTFMDEAVAMHTWGDHALPRLNERQMAVLGQELAKGPTGHGWPDQRWTLSRVKTVIGRRFHKSYTRVCQTSSPVSHSVVTESCQGR